MILKLASGDLVKHKDQIAIDPELVDWAKGVKAKPHFLNEEGYHVVLEADLTGYDPKSGEEPPKPEVFFMNKALFEETYGKPIAGKK